MWEFEFGFLQPVKNMYTLRPRIYYIYDIRITLNSSATLRNLVATYVLSYGQPLA